MRSSMRLSNIVFVIFLSIFFVGCESGQLFGPDFTPTATITNTPSPTSSNTPTLTPTHTYTPSPTVTPTIEPPSQISEFLENPRLTFYDNFDYLALEGWATNSCQTVSNGELEYACTDEGPLVRKQKLQEGEGILIDFKTIDQTSDQYYWSIHLSSGTYGEDDWRNFGIAESSKNGQSVKMVKREIWSGFSINWIKPDIWYRLALAIGDDARILVLAWERDNPGVQLLKYRNTLGTDWSDLEWFFWVNNDNTVTLYFDNLYQFAFDEIY